MTGRSGPAIEAGVACALAVVAVFLVIPAQTGSGGIGLDPADLPTACAILIAVLVAGDGVVRLAAGKGRGAPDQASSPRTSAGILAILLCILAAVLIAFVSVPIVAAILVPALMLVLGERGVLRITITTAITTAILALALGWRG